MSAAAPSPASSPVEAISLFRDLAAELQDRLADHLDWGLSGRKPGQYSFDVVADELLVPALVDAGFSVLTEESGITPGPSAVTVVVDPVDGSTNASHGLPWYATSLCSVDADGPVASLVVNLATGLSYAAIRGEGVEVTNGPPVAPSGVTDLSDALISLSGLPGSHGGWRQFRSYGACALDMCAVAAGVFDGFVDIDGAHGVWDYLGALLVCREAGATVVDGNGDDLVILEHGARRAPIAAGTPELAGDLVAMRKRVGRGGPPL